MQSESDDGRRVWTIGHWNLEVEAFLAPLREASIETVLDVRSLPGSRRSPQFDREEMDRWLRHAGLDYLHVADLGGRRRGQGVDPWVNAGWRNDSFHHYADYTLGEAFRAGLARLEAMASTRRVAVMCGEPVPWRCHRSIISDHLVTRGWTVVHLSTTGAPIVHELGRWGATPVVGDDATITYPDPTSADGRE